MNEPKIITNMRITEAQRATFQRLGGVKWFRTMLDRAAKRFKREDKKSLQL